jgi:hypothetical protein
VGGYTGLNRQSLPSIATTRGSGQAPGSVRLAPVGDGCLWGIRTEVIASQAFVLVTALQPMDCKSIAKASKVRILHLPPRAREGL